MPSSHPWGSRRPLVSPLSCFWIAVVLAVLVFPSMASAQVNNARVVSYDLPQSLACGESYTANITLENIGSTTWTRDLPGGGYKLGARNDDDPFVALQRVWLPEGVTVAPGQVYVFSLPMIAPTAPGTYLTDWQMVEEWVAWFGPVVQRQVTVSCTPAQNGAQVISHNLPASLSCGQNYTAQVTMKNIGTTDWTRDLPGGGFKLGTPDNADPFTSNHRVWLPTGVTVSPGQNYTFSIPMTAPSTEGNYFTDWRMVEELVEFFGGVASRNVSVTCQDIDDAEIVSAVLPTNLTCGQNFSGSVTVRNIGTTAWSRDLPSGGYKLAAVGGSDPLTSSNRVWLPSGVVVAPGQTYTFPLDLTAPSTAGSYVTDWQMVREGVSFFGAVAASNVNVSCTLTNNAALVTHNLPTALSCGQNYSASITLRNTGTTTWRQVSGDRDYKLGALGNDDPFVNNSRIWIPSGVTVEPNETHTFNFQMTAPSAPGTYLTDWRMVEELVEFFGVTVSQNVVVNCASSDDAQVISSTLPSSLSCGAGFNAQVTVKNTGTSTWTPGANYALATPGGDTTFHPTGRIPLPSSVAPNQNYTFNFPLTAPSTGGSYSTTWRMVKGNNDFFGGGASSAVTVTCQTTDNAQLISETLPSAMACGATANAAITLRNTGTSIWTRAAGYELAALGGTDPFYPGSAIQLPASAQVGPGQQITLPLQLAAPTTSGTYRSDWRMRGPSGFFGAAVIQDIAVTCTAGSNNAAVVSHTLPAQLACGETRSVNVTMRNTGTTTWTRDLPLGGYKLAAVDDSDPFVNNTRSWLPEGVEIAPNQNHTFTLSFTAPETPGSYLTQWRMVEEGVEFFGPTAARLIQVNCGGGGGNDAATEVSSNFPAQMSCNDSTVAFTTLRNTGTSTWGAGYRLLALGGSDPLSPVSSVPVPSGTEVDPGESYTFQIPLEAPDIAGLYSTQWRMSHDGVGGFGPVVGRDVNVSCDGNPTTDDARVIAVNAPPSADCSTTVSASITMENNGANAWSGNYRLRPTAGNPLSSTPVSVSGTVSPGQSHTFALSLNTPAQDGSYSGGWRMENASGQSFGATAVLNLPVACGGGGNNGEPEIFSLEPQQIPVNAVTRITVSGRNLVGAVVSIATEPAEPGDPVPTSFPTLNLVSGNAAGTQLVVDINTNPAGVKGFYNLVVETSEGGTGSAFRVIPVGPDVDLWTPSEPTRGRTYSLMITGVNLRGASIGSPTPGIDVFGIVTSDNRIQGFMQVASSTPVGATSLLVSNHGETVSVPITVLNGSSANYNQTMITEEAQRQASLKGELVPEIYFQDMAFDSELAVARGYLPGQKFCTITLGWEIYSYNYTIALPFDPETGLILRAILEAMGLGETIPTGVKIFSAFVNVGLELRWTCWPVSQVQICIYGNIGFEIPGLGGQILSATGCFFGGVFIPTVTTTGILGDFQWGQNQQCVSIDPITIPGDGGEQRANITMTDCCAEDLRITSSGTSFPGTIYEFNFSGSEVPVAAIEPDPATCAAPVCEHRGTPTNGSLVNDASLPNTGAGYYYFRGGDAADTDDWSCADTIHADLATVGAGWPATRPRIGIGDLSLMGGGFWGDHTSHQNGLDVDMRYVRSDGQEAPVSFNNPGTPAIYDQAATQEMVDALIAEGAVLVIVDNRSGITGAVVQYENAQHHNHIHVRFADPDGTTN
ncbi:MAG: penicillin-insensitive murein endopeptidase [Acidobacteriota bacterium]